MGLERRVLAGREELGREAEHALARLPRRRRARVRLEDPELRGIGRGAVGERERAARLVEGEAVQDAALELSPPDEDALDAEALASSSSRMSYPQEQPSML